MKWRIGIVLLLIVAAVLAVASGIDVSGLTRQFVEALQNQGDVGLVWLALSYIPASLFFFPASLLTLSGGFAFGVVKTVIAVSLGSTVGATSAFLAGRTLLRGLIEHRVAADPRFRALDAAVAEHGFKIVMLTRLSPVLPFNLLNYAFGLTKVRLRDFVLASWIGMFPGTLLYVSIGSAAKSLSDIFSGRSEGGVAQKVMFGVGLVVTLVVTVLMARIAKKALADATAAVSESNAEGKSA
ncbi:MAG: TVP38/TMEM64 family protein [Planctomycetaceae bacterium]